MSPFLIEEIKRWITDFEKMMPHNVDINEDTFDGSAYSLFNRILAEAEEGKLEQSAQEQAYNQWLYS